MRTVLAPMALLDPGEDTAEFIESAAGGGDEDGGSTQRASTAPTQVSGGTQRFVERVRVLYTAAAL